MSNHKGETDPELNYWGGALGALAPFAVFLIGVGWLGLSGAPDERGFWPILIAAMALGLFLAKDRHAWCDATVKGMGRPIVALMIMAWLLAGVLGALMKGAGLVEALVWLAQAAGLEGGGFVGACFLMCCAVSTATGTSLGTIVLCAPLLYPMGGALLAHPVLLMSAILGGATFGDNISPVSDTTIASATTQEAEMGQVVKSRLRYALPTGAVALVAFILLGGAEPDATVTAAPFQGSPHALPMLLAPALVMGLLLAGRHLVEGLMFGIAAAVALSLLTGLLSFQDLLYIDSENFRAKGLLSDGLEKGVGVSVFTLLMMGLTAGLEGTGMINRMVLSAEKRVKTVRGAEAWMFSAGSAAVLLTTHSAVALLAVGDFTKSIGRRFGVDPCRRANILDVTVCTWPFLLPYFIPTVLAAGMTGGAQAYGMPKLSAFSIGLNNFHSWGLLIMVLAAVVFGYGRHREKPASQGVS